MHSDRRHHRLTRADSSSMPHPNISKLTATRARQPCRPWPPEQRAGMADDEQPAVSGLMSPRRLEAIHISFNRVFDAAVKDGVIRDSATYRSFDDIIALSRTRKGAPSVAADDHDVTTPNNEPTPVLPTSVSAQRGRAPPQTAARIEVSITQSRPSGLPSSRTPPKNASTRSPVIENPPLPNSSPIKLRRSDPRSLVPGPLQSQTKKHVPPKRYRRSADEIDRRYRCNYHGCNKAYGYLHHLNTHRELAHHGRRMKYRGMRVPGTHMT